MKTLSTLTLGLLFGLGFAPHLHGATQFGRAQGRDRVCVYQDIRFQGWEQCYNVGDEVANLGKQNNAISSIRVYGRAVITVYEDTEFRGHQAQFNSDVPDLGLRNLQGSKSWSDHIQSLRVGSEGGAPPRSGPPAFGGAPPPPRVSEGVCVYDEQGFKGREQCWNAGTELNDLARAGNWSDRISSIRVFGGAVAVFYRDIQFRGESVVIDRDMPDLRQLSAGGFRNWNNQISSLVVEGRGRRGRARRY
jgi:hypothetical protein